MHQTSLSTTLSSYSYVFDGVSNRSSCVANGTDVSSWTYDSANRLLQATDVSGTTTYTYNANGNQLTIEEPGGDITTNTWDGENRLVQVEHPSGDIVTYAYNGDGLCVLEDDGVQSLETLYDGLNRVLEADSGTIAADYTTTPEAYGDALSQHRSGSNACTQQWQGQSIAYRKDADAGPEVQYAMHHRNYNPKSGVFAAADPAKDDLNLYRCVHNNPVNRQDPGGLQEELGRGNLTAAESRMCFLTHSEDQATEPYARADFLRWEQHVRCHHFQQPADRRGGSFASPSPASPSENSTELNLLLRLRRCCVLRGANTSRGMRTGSHRFASTAGKIRISAASLPPKRLHGDLYPTRWQSALLSDRKVFAGGAPLAGSSAAAETSAAA